MKVMISAAVVAAALAGCGPDLEPPGAAGAQTQAVIGEPVDVGPQRLTNEQIFGTRVQGSLNLPSFQDWYAYTVSALGPCR